MQTTAPPKKTFSIVVPVYFNELNLPDTVPKLIEIGKRLDRYRLELIFVDDGSADRSLELLCHFQDVYPGSIRIVKLTRNFGSMAAIQAGLKTAKGDCIGMIAADLQDPPELFLDMIGHWENGIKAVFAVRSDREESWLQKLSSNAYYWLIRRFAIRGYPPGGFDFFLIDRQLALDVNSILEKNTNVMSLIFWLGYPHVQIPYVRRRRARGRSRWTLAKKIKLFVDSFVSFSYIPIRFISILGIVYAIAAFGYGTLIFYIWATAGVGVQGWTALVLLFTFTMGVQLTMLGILGEYLWRALDESRKRPPYIVDRIIEH